MAALKEKILGHEKLWDLIAKAIEADNQSGSFLFVGPEGIGKKKLAVALAQYFLCQTESGCGHCGSCKRAEELTHEGILFIEPQNQMVKIEEATKIKEFLRLRSLSKKRFIIINDAHCMNLPFANAILKTLEEPTDGVIFILITHQPKSILATIKSRSRLMRFQSLEPETIKTITKEWGYESHNFLNRGQVNLIKNFLEEEKVKVLQQSLGFTKDLFFNSNLILQSEWRYFYKDKGQFMDFISLCPLILRDALVMKWDKKSDNLIFPDNKNEIMELAKASEEKIFKLNDYFRKIAKDIKWSPDPIFLLEKIIFELNKQEGHVHAHN
jgi:DNA polymerase-3 subunit delta'